MTESRFIDNQDGSITDTRTGLVWTKEDTWQTEATWSTWDEAMRYTYRLNDKKFCGFTDWRLPTRVEGNSLYCPDSIVKDKYGNDLHLDPVFPQGGLPTMWMDEYGTGNDGYIFDFRNGEIRDLYKNKSGRMAARPVRGEFKGS